MKAIKIKNLLKSYDFKRTNNKNICHGEIRTRFLILLNILIISIIIIPTSILGIYFLFIKRKNDGKNSIYNNKNTQNIFNIYNKNTPKQSRNLSNNNTIISYFNKKYNNINSIVNIRNNIWIDNSNDNGIKNNIFNRENNKINDNYKVFIFSIENIKYEITNTSYCYINCKYTKRGYYIEKENNCPVYIITGADSYQIDINEVKTEGNNVVIYIKDKYIPSKRILPCYGFTKIKFNRQPEKITILNYSGKYYLPA